MYRRWLITLATIVSCSTLACREGGQPTTQPAAKPAGKPRIALIMKAGTNPFFAKMEEGARRAAAKHDVDLTVLSLDRETDYEKQAAQVEAAVGAGVHAIVITPADSKALVAPLRRAQDQGILILNLDNRIDADTAARAGLKPLTFIGPDNAAGAEKATLELIRLLGGKGRIAMLEGVRGADNARQRLAGFKRAVEKHKDIQVVDTVVADWDISQGQEKMAALLARFADLDGVFCANDNMALGAIQAIESAGKTGRIRITAFDNLAAAQAAIKAGKLDATIEQHPDLMGEWGVENAVRALRGDTIATEIPVPTDLITAETLKAAK
jgi:ribose transport system substrate-binding protein